MFERLWRGRGGAGPRGVPGYRAYIVGDVHGRLDLLNGLLVRIEADHRARGSDVAPVLVFLGDLIDRGPQSQQVVERVLAGAIPGFQTIVLAGNHEEVLVRVLDGEPELLPEWLRFGGGECLQSYGLDPAAVAGLPERAALEEVRSAIPLGHQRFLADLGDTFRFGDYLCVHAGIRPGIALEDQSPIDLRWIRQPFLSDRRNHGFMVVHGHTITQRIDERQNRIGIDTGAYRFGVLTALAIEGGERWFLQEHGAPTDVKAAERQPATP